MSGKYEAAVLPEEAYDEWDRLVAESPEGSPYSTAAYLDVLCRCAGGRFRVLGVRHGQELVGGVALYERDDLAGTYVQPRLLLYYNGLVLRDYDTRYPSRRTSRHLGIMDELARALDERGYAAVELRCRSPRRDLRPFLRRGWSTEPSYSYVVPLEEVDALWDRVEQNLRRLVERAEDEGLSFTEDDDFDAYFRMHREVHERKGAPLYLPREAYARYVADLREAGIARLFHARLADGRSVAAQLVLAGDHPVTHTVSAAAEGDHQDTGANPFLRWKVFRALAGDGYRGNDLTDASLNSVTRFKSQLGGDLELNMVLRAPARSLHRLHRWGRRAYWRGRDRLSGAVRQALDGGDG